MSLSEYELRVLQQMEAEFAAGRPARAAWWRNRIGILLSLAALVLVVVLAVTVNVAVAAPVALGCGLVALVAVLGRRRRRLPGKGR
jgi:Flp pilus assembly protein TadB